jgi:alpha-mannosidase
MLELPEGLTLTAMKKCEESDSFVLRFFNSTEKSIKGGIKTVFKNAVRINMNEDTQEGEVNLEKLTVKPYEIVTVKVDK